MATMSAAGAWNVCDGAACVHYESKFLWRCPDEYPARVVSFSEQIIVKGHPGVLPEGSSSIMMIRRRFESRERQHERGSSHRLNPGDEAIIRVRFGEPSGEHENQQQNANRTPHALLTALL